MVLKKFIIAHIFISCLLFINVNQALIFKDNGYQNLVVSISPDIEEGNDGQAIIDNIKVMILEELSKYNSLNNCVFMTSNVFKIK